MYGLLEQIVSMKVNTMYNVYTYSVYKMLVYSLKYHYLKIDDIMNILHLASLIITINKTKRIK